MDKVEEEDGLSKAMNTPLSKADGAWIARQTSIALRHVEIALLAIRVEDTVSFRRALDDLDQTISELWKNADELTGTSDE
jgi:hypothetical protein